MFHVQIHQVIVILVKIFRVLIISYNHLDLDVKRLVLRDIEKIKHYWHANNLVLMVNILNKIQLSVYLVTMDVLLVIKQLIIVLRANHQMVLIILKWLGRINVFLNVLMEHMEMYLIINAFNAPIIYTKIVVFYLAQMIQIFNKLILNIIVFSVYKDNVIREQHFHSKHR